MVVGNLKDTLLSSLHGSNIPVAFTSVMQVSGLGVCGIKICFVLKLYTIDHIFSGVCLKVSWSWFRWNLRCNSCKC